MAVQAWQEDKRKEQGKKEISKRLPLNSRTMKRKTTVGFLTRTDPHDKLSWSGIIYRMLDILEQEFGEVIHLGPAKIPKMLTATLSTLNVIHRALSSKRYNTEDNVLISRYLARFFEKQLEGREIDVIFAPAAMAEIAYLRTSTPICYAMDTTVNQLCECHKPLPGHSRLSTLSMKESNFIQQKAIDNSATQVYSSEWASEYAIGFYKAKRSNTYIVKFGANLDTIPEKLSAIKGGSNAVKKLLFLATRWRAKGGDVAFEAFQILLNRGWDVALTVCGCVPPMTHPKMTVIPFLNKNINKESQEINRILSESHILFLPTRADCTPISFCEANAFGLPVITTDVGGVTAVIENGINGHALPLDASPEDYANLIQSLLEEPRKLKEMAVRCREKYDNELNWHVWGKKMKDILLLTINKRN